MDNQNQFNEDQIIYSIIQEVRNILKNNVTNDIIFIVK